MERLVTAAHWNGLATPVLFVFGWIAAVAKAVSASFYDWGSFQKMYPSEELDQVKNQLQRSHQERALHTEIKGSVRRALFSWWRAHGGRGWGGWGWAMGTGPWALTSVQMPQESLALNMAHWKSSSQVRCFLRVIVVLAQLQEFHLLIFFVWILIQTKA